MLRSPKRVEVRWHARCRQATLPSLPAVIVGDVGKPHAHSAETAKIEDAASNRYSFIDDDLTRRHWRQEAHGAGRTRSLMTPLVHSKKQSIAYSSLLYTDMHRYWMLIVNTNQASIERHPN
jgi:polysaccharide deacetylase 2 family uncharacterized protein YibQ